MSETVMHITSGAFESEVMKSDLPVLVDFYADWCGPCKMVSPVIEQLSHEYSGKAKFVKVDTDSNQDLAMRYGIMSIPTVMLFSGGKVKDVVIGAAPAGTYKSKLDAVVAK
jgi:thioredoxin